jgi:DNA modification methylase
MGLFLDDGDIRLYQGDVREVLADMPDGSVDCVVTSPPYWGLRDYSVEGQLGLEATPDEFVANMVTVFREVRRVLAPHGTCWVNLGDSYGSGTTSDRNPTSGPDVPASWAGRSQPQRNGLKPKDLVGIPWRVAFALQAEGWYLRADIIWAKPNPMPESVMDRPTKSHEYVFLLTKQPRYFFDQEAVREPHVEVRESKQSTWANGNAKHQGRYSDTAFSGGYNAGGRNVRSVWQIATQPYPEAHFATYPEELVRRCVLAGCPVQVCRVCGKPSERIVERGELVPASPRTDRVQTVGNGETSCTRPGKATGFFRREEISSEWSDCGHNDWRPGQVLDPFVGSGTTCKVARDHGRHSIGIDLSAEYLDLAARRLQQLSLLT